jgi:hypothetical protein
MHVTQAKIDDTDWRILAERVRRLQVAGVIVRYGAGRPCRLRPDFVTSTRPPRSPSTPTPCR